MFSSPIEAPSERLLYPIDLNAWRRWEASHHRVRRAKAAMTAELRRTLGRAAPAESPSPALVLYGSSPSTLIVIDAPTASQRAALLRPLEHLALAGHSVAVICPPQVIPLIPEAADRRFLPLSPTATREYLGTVTSVLASGNYLPLGARAYEWACKRGTRFVVVQHGVLTPFMAPLPQGAHLLAWSEQDATFWSAGRSDTTSEVVGSQLLWDAARRPVTEPVVSTARLTFLGQLHGIELGRAYMTRASYEFCRTTEALYRPHPSEQDTISRLVHRYWERHGIDIDRSDTDLVIQMNPVVSVFSTGILEAAARGIPAWVYPGRYTPAWLEALYKRYGMSHWGNDPTAPPTPFTQSPASKIIASLGQ